MMNLLLVQILSKLKSIATYNVCSWSCSIPFHRWQPIDLPILWVAGLDHEEQAARPLGLTCDTTSLEWVCRPNLNSHRIPGGKGHADRVRPECNDIHLCWKDVPAGNRVLEALERPNHCEFCVDCQCYLGRVVYSLVLAFRLGFWNAFFNIGKSQRN